MVYLRVGVVLLAVVTLLGVVSAQDKDKGKSTKEDKITKDDKTPVKVRGQLPPYFKKLGLSDDQRQKVLTLRASYKEKVDALRKKIDQLKAEEKEAVEKVLTADQLKRLQILRGGGK